MNLSFQSTDALELFQAGVTENIVQERTGNSSLKAHRMYMYYCVIYMVTPNTEASRAIEKDCLQVDIEVLKTVEYLKSLHNSV